MDKTSREGITSAAGAGASALGASAWGASATNSSVSAGSVAGASVAGASTANVTGVSVTWNTSVVLPTMISSSGRSIWGAAILVPLTKVPFVLPMSVMMNCPTSQLIWA